MKLGPISLVVRDMDAALEFYTKDLGLNANRLDSNLMELRPSEESSDPILIVRHDPKAEKPPVDAAGLYHYAILLPDRKSLAAAYVSLGKAGVFFDGYADHLVSEALYLTDPEGNGIEIYTDRPRDEWKFDEDGKVQMATQPLDIDSLLKELSGTPQDHLIAFPDGTRVGHIHLKVTELGRSIAFYQNLLGMDLMSYWGSAAFLSVDGYHHHIGMNTWESLGGPPTKTGTTGLECFTLKIPSGKMQELSNRFTDADILHTQDSNHLHISDPDGIEILVKASS
jgi:catechol 2,3-dioxygenase